jgi:hypothetical protein
MKVVRKSIIFDARKAEQHGMFPVRSSGVAYHEGDFMVRDSFFGGWHPVPKVQFPDEFIVLDDADLHSTEEGSYYSANRIDENSKPAGGHFVGRGVVIHWQDGPLGRGQDRKPPNGAFVEDVIRAALQRIRFYQATEFACEENADAEMYLDAALGRLNDRTMRRESEGTEGTHQGT